MLMNINLYLEKTMVEELEQLYKYSEFQAIIKLVFMMDFSKKTLVNLGWI